MSLSYLHTSIWDHPIASGHIRSDRENFCLRHPGSDTFTEQTIPPISSRTDTSVFIPITADDHRGRDGSWITAFACCYIGRSFSICHTSIGKCLSHWITRNGDTLNLHRSANRGILHSTRYWRKCRYRRVCHSAKDDSTSI